MSYSRSGLPHSLPTLERNFLSAPLQAGVPVLDQDINIMQRITVERHQNLFRALFRAGWTTINESNPLADFTGLGINVMTIVQPQQFVFNGMTITFAETQTVSNQITVPASTTGSQLLFLEFWFEELDDLATYYRYGNVNHYNSSYFTNDIIDPAVGDPAAVRLQLRYRLRIVDGAQAMTDATVFIQGKKSTPDSVRHFSYDSENNIYYHDTTLSTSVGQFDDYDGIVYATPICWLERTISDPDVSHATIHDLRTPASHRVNRFGLSTPDDPMPGDCRNVAIIGQFYSPEFEDTVAANAVTVRFCQGNVHFIDLAPATADVDLTLEGGVAGGVYYLVTKQHPTAPVQLNYPGNIDWLIGTPLRLSNEPEDIDVICLVCTANTPTYRAFGYGKFGGIPPAHQEDLTVVGNAAVDWLQGSVWRLFLGTANDPFTLTLSNPVAGATYILKLVQGATPVDMTYPAEFKWLNGEPFVMSDTPFGVDILVLYYDGVYYWIDALGASTDSYIGLNDTTDTSYSGKSGYVPHVVGNALTLVPPSTLLASTSLDDLGDVAISGPTSCDVLHWNGSTWVNTPLATVIESCVSLASLSDVYYNGSYPFGSYPAWNLVLSWDGVSQWTQIPLSIATEAEVNLDNLKNVYGTDIVLGGNFTLHADGSGNWTAINITDLTESYVNLNHLHDVVAPVANPGDVLSWDGSSWAPLALHTLTETYVDLDNLKNVYGTNIVLGANFTLHADGSGNWTAINITDLTESYVNLNHLHDVVAPVANPGDVLYFAGSAWQPVSPSSWGNSFLSLDNLSDVSTGGPTSGDLLTWNGSAWTAQAPSRIRPYRGGNQGTTFELTPGDGLVQAVSCTCYVPNGYTAQVFGKLVTRDHANQYFYSNVVLYGPSMEVLDTSQEGNNDDDANTYCTVTCMGGWTNFGSDGTYTFYLYVQAVVRGFEVSNSSIQVIAAPVS